MGEKNGFYTKAKSALQDYRVYLLLFFVILVQTLGKLYTLTLQNILTPEYLLGMATSIASTMLIYVFFAPFGSEKETERNAGYRQNLLRWSELSAKIRAGRNAVFTAFCKKRETEEREERRREIIENNTMTSYAEYLEKYSEVSERELKRLYKAGRITKTEYKALKKAARSIRVKPINPLLILCGVEHRSLNDAGREEANGFIFWIIKRPAVILITDILIGSINPLYNGVQSAEAIYSMILSALSTIVSAYVGYRAGVSRIVEKNEIVKNRIFFIETFEEAEKSPKNA